MTDTSFGFVWSFISSRMAYMGWRLAACPTPGGKGMFLTQDNIHLPEPEQYHNVSYTS